MAGKHQPTAQVTDPGILSRTTFELSQLLGALAKEPSKSTIRRTGSGRACLHSFPVPHAICNSHQHAYDRHLRPLLKALNSIRARNGAARLAEHDTAQGVPSATTAPRKVAASFKLTQPTDRVLAIGLHRNWNDLSVLSAISCMMLAQNGNATLMPIPCVSVLCMMLNTVSVPAEVRNCAGSCRR